MDNLILEKLGCEEAGSVYSIKITGFNASVCMSVKVPISREELLTFGEECRMLLHAPLMHQWGEEEGAGDCLKLMLRGQSTGAAEGRVFMKAEVSPSWSDTACFAITATLGDFDAFGAAMPAFLEGDTGTVLALRREISY